MTDQEINEFDSADRMVEFNTRNPNVFGNNAKMTSNFESLEADIATLENQGALRITSEGMRSDGTRDKSAARTALYALVRKASNTGKLIKRKNRISTINSKSGAAI